MQHYRVLFVLLSGSLGLAGCSQPPGKNGGAGATTPARVIAIQFETIPDVLEAPGSVQPRARIQLSSQIQGFVKEMRVRAGDAVRTGQVLAVLDAREAESQKAAAQAMIDEAAASRAEAEKAVDAAAEMLRAARASAGFAEGTFARYEKLHAAQSISPQELDEARTRRDAAHAEVAARESMVGAAEARLRQVESRIRQAQARAQSADVLLGWSLVQAPASGRVVERLTDAGSAVYPGSPLLVLESTTRAQVRASLPSAQAGRLRPGLEVTVRHPDQGVEPVSGTVTEIVPMSDRVAHTTDFKVDLPEGFAPPSGSFVLVRVPVGERRVLLAPRTALRETGQLTGLFVADASATARLRLVKAQPYDAERIQVLSGIEAGERILASPTADIVDGTPLEIRP